MKRFFLLLICVPVGLIAQQKPPGGISMEADKFTKSTVYKLSNPGSFSGANNSIQPEIIQTDTELFLKVKFVHRGFKEVKATKITVALGDGVEMFTPSDVYSTTFTRFSSGMRALNVLAGPSLTGNPDSIIEVYTVNLKAEDLERFVSLFAEANKKAKLALRFENSAMAIDYPNREFHTQLILDGTLKGVINMVNFYQTLANQ